MKIEEKLLLSLLKIWSELPELLDNAHTAWTGFYPITENSEEDNEYKRLESEYYRLENFERGLMLQIGSAWISFGKDTLPIFSDSELRYFGFASETYAKNWLEWIRNRIDWEESSELNDWLQ